MARAIGIDLGTTYTVVATIEDGRPKVIPNAEGQHLTPSVVSFDGGEKPLVGQTAKRLAATNADMTVFSIKRRMGSNYKVRVADKGYTPQEISGFILQKVKTDAEHYLGEKIDRAVITVPAYFNDRQRQATLEAGHLAGLDVMRIINEPTAAALAYGLEREDVHTVLVWDLGGGTFDVSILELGEGIFEVKAVSGDTWLGGDDFDSRVMEYLAEEYRRATGIDLPTDSGTRQRLREAAENAKIQLSSSSEVSVHIPTMDSPDTEYPEVQLTREHLESLTKDLLHRVALIAQQAMTDAELLPEHIDRVILVGGSTRMPAVRNLARQLLGKEPYRYIDPDEVVAAGAAIQAGMLLGIIEKAVLLDVLPLSLGLETQGGLVARIIPRNTPLPASGARIFTTAVDYQTSMDIHILQGERELAVDNISLGQLQLKGIPSAHRGVPKVEVAFEADADGIVHVHAIDLLAEGEAKIDVISTKLLDTGEVEHMAEEARRSAAQDKGKRARIEADIEAENVIAATHMALGSLAGSQADQLRRQALQGLSNLEEARASGVAENIRACSGKLRELLAEIGRERLSLAAANVEG